MIDVFREDEQRQDHECHSGAPPRKRHHHPAAAGTRPDAGAAIPPADFSKNDHPEQRRDGKPGNACLSARQYDEGGQQRPERRPGIAADLEQRLRQPVAAAGRHSRDARRLGMENCRSDPDESRTGEQSRVACRERQKEDADEARSHTGARRVRDGPAVGEATNKRLQKRCSYLKSHREKADLPKREAIVALQHRIYRCQQRLHDVVEQMTKAHRQQD